MKPKIVIVLSVFGSRVCGDLGMGSDLELLYRLEDRFIDRYSGWAAYKRIETIKSAFGKTLFGSHSARESPKNMRLRSRQMSVQAGGLICLCALPAQAEKSEFTDWNDGIYRR